MVLKKTVNRSSKLFFLFSDCSPDIDNSMIFRSYDEKRWKLRQKKENEPPFS
ncbi:hypothetical protein J8995_23560 [Klebsiella quasipneumoniae subsp. quasipneumoniae]|nr:hypothetical protein [Klebsiella quasipneumoniae]MCS6404467.1 hypothetical protein [Klebsiella quasipneumoniae subsp. quasipneumoniae]HDZ9750453.1 hypothetical protein [Klebsiella quasipneumoniae subsp. similipneumoniae]EKU0047398.1 hypothetical protein [Klebsiella quasipneumoniae]EKU3498273.1 hypothetical protein [Klebsiella quasipneumoniae]